MIFILLLLFTLFSVIALIPLDTGKIKYFIFVSIAVIMILVAGFRNGNYVRDYDMYVDMFNDKSEAIVEPSFLFISYVSHALFGNNPIYLFVFFAILGVSLKFFAIKQLTELWFLSILIYFSSLFVLHELTQIRAGIASAILLLCIKPIYERDLKRFLFFSFLAFSFHFSAILFFPLWFIGKDPRKKILIYSIPLGYVAYFLGFNIIYTLPIPGIQEKIETYKQLQEFEGEVWDNINVFNLVFLAKIAIFYFMLWKYELFASHNKYFPILMKIYCLSLMSFLLFSVLPVVAFRVNELLGAIEIILLPLLFYSIKEKMVSRVVVLIIAALFLYIWIFYSKIIL